MSKIDTVACDFDGTVVRHEYPQVGADLPQAERVLKRLVANGKKIVLFTMRSNGSKEHPNVLKDAVQWFSDRDIPLYGVNHNPTQHFWTESPKAYAQCYVDDAALGCPLLPKSKPWGQYPEGLDFTERDAVDWMAVEEWLEERGVLPIGRGENDQTH